MSSSRSLWPWSNRYMQAERIERAFGRPVPALIHDLEYREEVADVNRSANPPGLVAEFDTWVRSL